MGKIITFTLDPDNPPTLSDEAREKLENLTDQEIDDSDIPEFDDDMPAEKVFPPSVIENRLFGQC